MSLLEVFPYENKSIMLVMSQRYMCEVSRYMHVLLYR